MGPGQVGMVTRGAFSQKGSLTTLFTNSRERHQEILARLRAARDAPVEVIREKVDRHPQGAPGGPQLIVDSQSFEAPEGLNKKDAERYLRRAFLQLWSSKPIPALGGLTPLQAMAAGRKAELWAVTPVELVEELGLQEPALQEPLVHAAPDSPALAVARGAKRR